MAAKKTTAPKTSPTAKTPPTTKRKSTTKGKSPTQTTTKKTAEAKSTTKPSDKKLSAIDAAAKVLGEVKEPLTSLQMIEQMAAKGYWTSPGGKTPQATLYAAIIREIQSKGKESRFQKTDRGQFALNTCK